MSRQNSADVTVVALIGERNREVRHFLENELGAEGRKRAVVVAATSDRAVVEVTDQPHNGCAKFAARFGRDAHKIVWTEDGQRLRLRGLNARVLVGGTIVTGDTIRQLPPSPGLPAVEPLHT